MAVYITAFVTGVLQFLLLRQILDSVFKSDILKVFIYIGAKAVLYIVPVIFLIRLFRQYAAGAAIGFGAGFALCLIIFIIYSSVKKNSGR